jgi:TatA/E family protein of Tat protein translocase
MFLLVFEFLGTTELLVIAMVALLIFGPRKLPELGRTVGKWMAEFKRASEDFKRTWEYEVEVEGRKPPPEPETYAAPAELDAPAPTPDVADWTPPDPYATPEAPEGETVPRAIGYGEPSPPQTSSPEPAADALAREREGA